MGCCSLSASAQRRRACREMLTEPDSSVSHLDGMCERRGVV